jgi:predicted RNA-binding protein Jag
MAIQELKSPTADFTYRFKYSSNHLNWIQFFNDEFNITPRLIFFYEDRCVIVIDSDKYSNFKWQWDCYYKNRFLKIKIHIRIIDNSNSIEGLIQNWFQNIKDIKVKFDITYEDEKEIPTIFIQVAKNLRQFVIGKGGFELRILEYFINNHLIIDGYKQHKNSYRCVVI